MRFSRYYATTRPIIFDHAIVALCVAALLILAILDTVFSEARRHLHADTAISFC